MEKYQRISTWLGVVLGALAVWLLVCLAPHYSYEPRGLLLPEKQVLPAVSADQVALYANAPSDFQSLGTISIEMHYRPDDNQAISLILDKAQSLAATVGANGFLVGQLYHSASSESKALTSYYFYGLAIHTSEEPEANALSDLTQRLNVGDE